MTKLMMNGAEIKTTSDKLVPVTGGTLKGELKHSTTTIMKRDDNAGYIRFEAGGGDGTKTAMYLFGKDCPSTTVTPHGFNAVPGGIVIKAIPPTGKADPVTLTIKPGHIVPFVNDIPAVMSEKMDLGSSTRPVYISAYELKECDKLYKHCITSNYSDSAQVCFYIYTHESTAYSTYEDVAQALYNNGYSSFNRPAFGSAEYSPTTLNNTIIAGVYSDGTNIRATMPHNKYWSLSSTEFTSWTDVIKEIV